jgi:sugar phosphate isomerase/epimerase
VQDALGPGSVLGYCTNVHAGATLAEMQANLERHAVAVKARASPRRPLGVGLWLPASAACELVDERRVAELADWLGARGLEAFTFNGFPFGDFHREVVKHEVYRPDWTTDERREYTLALIDILAGLLGDRDEGSLSTLPVGWRAEVEARSGAADEAARQLVRIAEHLREVEARTGKLIHVDLEPEPGCYLDTGADVVRFFNEHLLRQGDEGLVRRHLRVCHDVCHAAVMFESQAEMLQRYRAEGIAVGKVQLSAALRAGFDRADPSRAASLRAELERFAEDRYLHQTMAGRQLFDDLPQALSAAESDADLMRREWRVHFHVPLFLEGIGGLETTADQIDELLRLTDGDAVRHFEVETYAWTVLPADLRGGDLAEGIARELDWVLARAAQRNTA